MGPHLRVLNKSYSMNTNITLAGFQKFLRPFFLTKVVSALEGLINIDSEDASTNWLNCCNITMVYSMLYCCVLTETYLLLTEMSHLIPVIMWLKRATGQRALGMVMIFLQTRPLLDRILDTRRTCNNMYVCIYMYIYICYSKSVKPGI